MATNPNQNKEENRKIAQVVAGEVKHEMDEMFKDAERPVFEPTKPEAPQIEPKAAPKMEPISPMTERTAPTEGTGETAQAEGQTEGKPAPQNSIAEKQAGINRLGIGGAPSTTFKNRFKKSTEESLLTSAITGGKKKPGDWLMWGAFGGSLGSSALTWFLL